MEDSEIQRYSRQLLLNEVDFEGQEKLLSAAVMLVGVGGLGTTAAQLLASAGVGRLVLWDDDIVDLSNLPRQPLYSTDQVGMPKVEAAAIRLKAINPGCQIETYQTRPDMDNAIDAVKLVDIILDCTDNYASRCLINKLAVSNNKPLVVGAGVRFEGQVMTFQNQGGPCYGCLSSQLPIEDVPCREVGVLNSLVSTIASLQVQATLKHIIGINSIADGRLLMVDGKYDQFDTFNVTKNPGCSICS